MSGAAPTEAASAARRLAIPAQQQQFLAFDFGSKRTGVASGNRLLGAGQPLSPPSKLKGLRPALPPCNSCLPNGSRRRWSLACPTTPMGPRTRTPPGR